MERSAVDPLEGGRREQRRGWGARRRRGAPGAEGL